MSKDKGGIEQHADAHEKQEAENITEWSDNR
jgi:hypothetical protein